MQNSYLFQPPALFYLIVAVIIASFFKDPLQAQFSIVDENVIELGLGLVTLFASFRMARGTTNLGERLFWFNIRLAMTLWFLTKLGIYVSALNKSFDAQLKVAAYGYFSFFMALVFAVILKNYQTRHREVIALQQYGAIFFVLGVFAYLVIIPSQTSQNEFRQLYSSFIFYIVLDVYLLLLFIFKGMQSRRTDSFRTYFWFGFSSLTFLMLDLTEVLQFAELIDPVTHSLYHTLFYIPYIGFIMAMNPKAPAIPKSGRPVPTWVPSPLLTSVAILPVIHALGHSLGWFYDEAEVNREWLLVIWVASFIFLISKQESYIVQRYRKLRGKYENLPRIQQQVIKIKANPFPQILLDPGGRIVSANTGVSDLLGYHFSQLQGQLFSCIFEPDDAFGKLFSGMETSIHSGQRLVSNAQREVTLQTSTGHPIPCYMRTLDDDEGNLLVSFVDISPLKQAENQALSVKDKFIANITHEFRTPLTIIQGALEESIDADIPDKIKHRMNSALKNNARILKMVEQLLTLSKLTSAPKLNATAQPLSEMVRNTVELFGPICEHKKMQFHHNLVDGLWAKIHEDSLQQILYNLLSNAYKYTPEGGTIELNMQVHGELLAITVSDTGMGMDVSDTSDLFDRFKRAENEDSLKTFGVGIGLSVVNELVQAHAWQMSVKSKPNVGSQFTIDIPLTEASTEFDGEITPVTFLSEDAPSYSPQVAPDEKSNTDKKDKKDKDRLLIIEDNADMQEYLAHLTELNFDTHIAGLGKQGLTDAQENIPDIIICDLMLPDISGFDVVEKLKANELTAHIPVLMLTAKADMDSRLEGLQRQVDDYLTKPFHYKELLLRLRNLLTTRESMQARLKAELLSEKAFGKQTQSTTKKKSTTDNAAVSNFLERLNTIVGKHYQDEAFNMGDLAGQLGLSERQLQRKMRGVLSLTPGEYLREYRLIKAKELLQTGIQVGLVADQVGFSSQAYFTKCFKEWLGETPSAFQRQEQTSSVVK